jgi:hypothetical protein
MKNAVIKLAVAIALAVVQPSALAQMLIIVAGTGNGGGGGGGIAVVTHASAAGSSGSTVTTSGTPVNTTGANACFVAVSGYALTLPGGTTVTDHFGNTYTEVPTTNGESVQNVQLFYSKALTVGTGDYWSASTTSGGFMAIASLCVSGALTSGGADQEADARPPASTSVQAGSVTPSNTNQIVLNVTGTDGTAQVSSTAAPFTLFENVSGGAGNFALGFSYQIQTTATTENPVVTLSTTPTNPSMAINASFKSH